MITAVAIALLIAIFVYGGPSTIPDQSVLNEIQETRDAVIGTVDEPARAGRILMELEAAEQAIRDFDKEFVRTGKDIGRLYSRYDATPKDFEGIMGQISDSRMKARRRIVEARFKAKELMTPEEWKAVFGAKAKSPSHG